MINCLEAISYFQKTGSFVTPPLTSIPTTSFAAIIIKARVVLDDDEYDEDKLLLVLMMIKNLQLNHPLGALWSP